MQVPWWLCPDSGKAYQPVTIVKLVLIKQSGTEFFKIFFFLKVEVNFNCSNVLEAWSYMNDPPKLDALISNKQFLALNSVLNEQNVIFLKSIKFKEIYHT